MKKLQVILACLVCRLARWGIRLLGRGGTSLPGKLALKVCPDLLSRLGRNVDTVVLTVASSHSMAGTISSTPTSPRACRVPSTTS